MFLVLEACHPSAGWDPVLILLFCAWNALYIDSGHLSGAILYYGLDSSLRWNDKGRALNIKSMEHGKT